MPSSRVWVPAIVSILFLAACAGTPAPDPSAVAEGPAPQLVVGEFGVEMRGSAFIPQKLTIKVGSTVVWTNMDFTQHDLQSDTGVFSAPLIDSGQTFRFVFDEPGTYPYFCSKHGGPNGAGMSGVIYVVP